LALGCDGDDGPPVPTTVEVTPATSTLNALDATVQFTAEATDVNGQVVTGVEFDWESSNESVATVDQDGLATAVANGTADITATVTVDGGISGSATLTVTQVPASVEVTPDPATLVYVGETLQYSAAVEDANGNAIASATVTWSSSDPGIVDVDAATGLATAVFPGSATITGTADPASDDAAVTVDIRRRPEGDIVFYRNYDPWLANQAGGDTATLNAAPFNFVAGTDYFIQPTSDLASGIPSTTSLIIFPSASQADVGGQITDQNAAAADLEAWVTAGGWLVVHGADNAPGAAYIVPGLTGIFDDILSCTGQTLLVSDNAFIRGPDATLGTADDLTDANIDTQPNTNSCFDNHGSLAGILPGNAEIYIQEEGGTNRPIYATYELGAGRVIVTTITLEWPAEIGAFLPTMRNHFYWAIYGLDAPAAPSPVVRAPSIFRRPATQEVLDSSRPPSTRQN
jgi:hypothetical protein